MIITICDVCGKPIQQIADQVNIDLKVTDDEAEGDKGALNFNRSYDAHRKCARKPVAAIKDLFPFDK